MSMGICVSVIVPVYNVERYINRCVDSLLCQTYAEIEILLIDDGSRDRSYAICKEYEKKDYRIHVFHKENEGLGLTRNYGIERASGAYLTFVDSDDYLTSDAIEIMLKKAEETQADVVIANHFYKGKVESVVLPERLYCGDEVKNILMVHMMGNKATVLDALSYTAWAKLYKASLFTENNLVFPSERKMIWEDLAFSINAYPYCNRVYVMHDPVYYYCFNEGSLTHTYKANKIELVMLLYHYMVSRINELGMPDEAMIRLQTNFVGHVRTCIKLETYYAKEIELRKAISNIREICGRDDVQKLIRSYPKRYFSRVQSVYNFFMRYKATKAIYLLTWVQNKRKRIE